MTNSTFLIIRKQDLTRKVIDPFTTKRPKKLSTRDTKRNLTSLDTNFKSFHKNYVKPFQTPQETHRVYRKRLRFPTDISLEDPCR